jgi:trk system potassium uptake protein TrkA
MGHNLAASIMSVAVAKEQGVPLVVAKSSSDRMSSILLKVGADKILDPEGEGGKRSARILLSSSFKDYFELDSNLYMIELSPEKDWLGRAPEELNLRRTRNMHIVAVKEKGMLWHILDPKKPLDEDCILLVVMEKKDLERWN